MLLGDCFGACVVSVRSWWDPLLILTRARTAGCRPAIDNATLIRPVPGLRGDVSLVAGYGDCTASFTGYSVRWLRACRRVVSECAARTRSGL